MRYALLALVLVLSAATAAAQPALRLFHFHVDSLLTQQGNEVVARIPFGSEAGVRVGARGKAVSVAGKAPVRGGYPETPHEIGGAALGSAIVTAVEQAHALVTLRLTDPASVEGRLYVGDVIELPVTVPDVPAGQLYELLQVGIYFQDAYGSPLYNFASLALEGEDEQAILFLMAISIQSTASLFFDENGQMTGDASLTTPLTRGYYAGKAVVEVMRDVEVADVQRFLRYVHNFSASYLGGFWRIDETFATWVMYHAPPAESDLLAQLQQASPAVADSLALAYQEHIRNGDFLTHWNLRAEKWGDESRYDEAHALLDLTHHIATLYGDATLQAWAIFSRAQVYADERKYDQSNATYTRAHALFTEAGHLQGESFAVNNIGHNLKTQGRYAEALPYFEESVLLKHRLLEQQDDAFTRTSLGRTYWGVGDVQKMLGNYAVARTAFDAATAEYETAGTLDARKELAIVWLHLGDLAQLQSQNAEAVTAYRRAERLSRHLSDLEGQADALDKIAYVAFLEAQYERVVTLVDSSYTLHRSAGSLGDAGYARSQRGQALWNLGRYDDAVAAHEEAIQLREQGDDRKGVAFSWRMLGDLYRLNGDPQKAFSAFETALSLSRAQGDKEGEAVTLNSMGEGYFTVQDYPRARDFFRQTLDAYRTLGIQTGIAKAEYDLGRTAVELKLFEEASAHFDRSLTLRRALNDRTGEVDVLHWLGFLHENKTHAFDEAETYYRTAIAIADSIAAPATSAEVLNRLGGLLSLRGQYDAAETAHWHALTIYSALSDRANEGYTWLNLAYLAEMRGDFEEAQRIIRETLALADSTGNNALRNDAANRLGGVYLIQGRLNESEAVFQQNAENSRANENVWGEAAARFGQARVHNLRGDNAEALRLYQQADSLYATFGSDFNTISTTNGIGNVRYFQGEYDEALRLFRQAREVLAKYGLENGMLVTLESNIGEVLLAQEKYDEAVPPLERAVALAEQLAIPPDLAGALAGLGRVRLAQERYDEARQHLERARSLFQEQGVLDRYGETTGVLGQLYLKTGQPEAAAPLLDEAVSVLEPIGAVQFLYEPLYWRGVLKKEQGDLTAAETSLMQAVDVVETLRQRVAGGEKAQQTFSSGVARTRVYTELVTLLAAQNQPEKALYYAQRSASSDVQAWYKNLDLNTSDPALLARYEQARTLKAQNEQLDAQIAALEAAPDREQKSGQLATLRQFKTVAEREYALFLDELIEEQPSLQLQYASTISPDVFLSQKQQIPDDAAVVLYLMDEAQLFAFVATADTVVIKVVPVALAELDAAVTGFHRLLSDRASATERSTRRRTSSNTDTTDVATLAEELYGWLIAPLEAEIAQKPKLAVVPAGPLHYLPFQALRSGPGAPLLLESHTLFYISDFSHFTTTGPADRPMKIVAFGNADSTLQHAEAEVLNIASRFPGTDYFLHANASEERFKQLSGDYAILHFATHGTLDFEKPNRSFLTLAPSSTGEDGRLELSEIKGMPDKLRQYRLVTLSACNTAFGQEIAPGRTIHPGNAFLRVGVPTVVASLWPVDDAATARFMRHFYEHLPELGAAAALRQAQHHLAADPQYAHPYFWAPFILLGDWR